MLPSLMRRGYLPSAIEDFFDDDFFFPGMFNRQTGKNMPAVNVAESEKEYRVEVAAPGLEKKDFKVELDENVLTISSEKEEKREDKEENYTRREFSYTSFNRSFTLPEEVNKDKIKAEHKDGVLTIHIPKAGEAKSKLKKLIQIS